MKDNSFILLLKKNCFILVI